MKSCVSVGLVYKLIEMFRRILKSAAVLASGTIGGQLFVVAMSPILTRLYGPEEFGFFGVYAAILYMVVSFSALRYEIAIPLAENDEDAKCLTLVSLSIVIIVTVALTLFILIVNEFFPLGKWMIFKWTLPIGVFMAGIYNVLVYHRLRLGDHALIAKTRVLQSFGGVIVQMISGLLGVGVIGLILGQIVGLSSGITKLQNRSIWKDFRKIFSRNHAMVQLKKQKDFAIFDAPAALIAIANTHAPTLLIAALFSPTSAGLYALVQRVLITPFGLISNALSISLISHGREIKIEEASTYSNKAALSALVISPLAICGAFVSFQIFPVIFGNQWKSAGIVAAWIILFVGQKFIFDSIFSLLAMQGRQKRGLQVQFYILMARFSILTIAGNFLSFELTLAVFSLLSAIAYFYATILLMPTDYSNKLFRIILGLMDVTFPYFVLASSLIFTVPIKYMSAIICVYGFWCVFRIYPHAISLTKMAK